MLTDPVDIEIHRIHSYYLLHCIKYNKIFDFIKGNLFLIKGAIITVEIFVEQKLV